jgi:hypothetical protein
MVEHNGQKVSNPARDAAVFVVHGMGQQAYPDTAVQLRNGFEDALDILPRPAKGSDVPTPFIFDGFWANYDDFEHTFPEEWARASAGERAFFTKLWERRSRSALRAAGWLAWQGWRLLTDSNARAKTPWFRWFTYWWVVFLAWVGIVYLLVRHRTILADVLGDVRLYADPRGQVQHVIVQRIERSVGERFLLLLGLNWDFRTLDVSKQLKISGEPHRFRYVTWVAHSLGSVVSYNVISDLLRAVRGETAAAQPTRCAAITEARQELRRISSAWRWGCTASSRSVLRSRIRLSISPGLRAWPAWFRQVCRRNAALVVNFFHIWDAVSGRLLDIEFSSVENLHSALWRIRCWRMPAIGRISDTDPHREPRIRQGSPARHCRYTPFSAADRVSVPSP